MIYCQKLNSETWKSKSRVIVNKKAKSTIIPNRISHTTTLGAILIDLSDINYMTCQQT